MFTSIEENKIIIFRISIKMFFHSLYFFNLREFNLFVILFCYVSSSGALVGKSGLRHTPLPVCIIEGHARLNAWPPIKSHVIEKSQ